MPKGRPRTLKDKICPTCRQVFQHRKQKFCSRDCYIESLIKMPDKDLIVETLNSTLTVHEAAEKLSVSQPHLHKWMRDLEIVKVTYYE